MDLDGAGERWPLDRPWLWAVAGHGDEDGWDLDVPPDALDELESLRRLMIEVSPQVTVRVRWSDTTDEPGASDTPNEGTIELMSGPALAALVAERLEPLERLGDSPCSPARLADLVDALGVLAVVSGAWLDQAGHHDRQGADAAIWAETARRAHDEVGAALIRRVRARRDGTFRVRLLPPERELIRRALEDLASGVSGADPSLRRLFPTAYPDDDERQAAWDILARAELIESRRATIRRVCDALDERTLDAEQLLSFMRALNDVRLVIGTKLDIGEDGQPSGPLERSDMAQILLYEHLGRVLDDVVAALRTTL